MSLDYQGNKSPVLRITGDTPQEEVSEANYRKNKCLPDCLFFPKCLHKTFPLIRSKNIVKHLFLQEEMVLIAIDRTINT
jgi:hypothetical protein